MDHEIVNYIFMALIIGMILTTWVVLQGIDADTNALIKHIEQENQLINNGSVKTHFTDLQDNELLITTQNHHILQEILANVTANNGVLQPRTH